jgi:hypothetical protein
MRRVASVRVSVIVKGRGESERATTPPVSGSAYGSMRRGRRFGRLLLDRTGREPDWVEFGIAI